MERETQASFFAKAQESLEGAESELANRRFNNCANRCYYACFQAAIAALAEHGFSPRGGQWGHDYVQAEFLGQLLNRRKLYPTSIRETLERTYAARRTADYKTNHVTGDQASRAWRRAREFMAAIREQGGEN